EKITGNVNNDLKRVFSCKVLALNPTFDLALVQIINPPQNLKALSLSDLSQVGIGEPTVAIGHPGGGAPWSLTTGKISASFENYGNSKGWDVFQTETSLNPGNSGGPLLDGSGAIIGVNTFIIRKSDSGLALTGLNFAVKSSTVRYWIREIIGQLPTVSEVSKSRQEKPTEPSGEDIEKATPPAPEKKAPKAFVEKGKEKRDSELPKSPEKEKAYTSKIEPGKVYGGKDLDSFLESYKKEYQDFRQQQQVEYKEFLKSKR
ncbi:serine protease, partial [bacterium]|nr:serine protease [bacterium]